MYLVKLSTIFFFKKKTAHAYFERPYFSKSFGGKIEKLSTDVTYRNQNLEKFLKEAHAYLENPYFFPSLLAGKLYLKQMLKQARRNK